MRNGFRDMAQRIENAQANFIDNVCEQFGTTKPQAEKVLAVFKKAKAVKLDAVGGRYNLTHGAYWECDVIQRAIDL